MTRDIANDVKRSENNVQSFRERWNKKATEQRAPQREKTAKSQIFKPCAIMNYMNFLLACSRKKRYFGAGIYVIRTVLSVLEVLSAWELEYHGKNTPK